MNVILKYFILSAFILVLGMNLTVPISAHHYVLPTAWPDYTRQAYAVLQGPRGLHSNFARLRSAYSQTQYYDPLGQRTIKSLDQLAMQYDMATTVKDKESFKKQFEAVFFKHLGHLGVVRRVYDLSRINPALGDQKLLVWMMQGLQKSALQSGEGTSLAKAYRTITPQENSFIINMLPLENKEILTEQESSVHYIAVKGLDIKTGQRKFVYIDESVPVRYILAHEENSSKNKLMPQ